MPKERYKLNVTLNTPTREYYVTFEADSIDEAVSVLLANEPSCTSMVIVFSVPRQIVVDLDQVSDEAQQFIYDEGLKAMKGDDQ